MVREQVYYKSGVQKSLYDSHARRNVTNSLQFVIPLIKPDFKVLDVGSGPGSITIDFSNYIPEGTIIGVEPTQELIDVANEKKAEAGNPKNVSFQYGSIYKLPFEDNSFDLVYAHQVILHLDDPTTALRELKRVTKPNGYVCVKDADLKAAIVYPSKYEKYFDIYVKHRTSGANSTDPISGRRLREKAITAGYIAANINSSTSNWTIANEQERQTWASVFTNRLTNAEKLLSDDPVKDEELRHMGIKVWEGWVKEESGYAAFTHGQFLYQKESS